MIHWHCLAIQQQKADAKLTQLYIRFTSADGMTMLKKKNATYFARRWARSLRHIVSMIGILPCFTVIVIWPSSAMSMITPLAALMSLASSTLRYGKRTDII